MKILFVTNQGTIDGDGPYDTNTSSTGLVSSVKFVQDMLSSMNHESKLIAIKDFGQIEKFVDEFKPSFVIIEAVFVTPALIRDFTARRPGIVVAIRIHSELPFIAVEGHITEWMRPYSEIPNCVIASNSDRLTSTLMALYNTEVLYLPNYYSPAVQEAKDRFPLAEGSVKIGCFGAVRLLKNQYAQAVSAMIYANRKNIKLEFHMNSPEVGDKFSTQISNNIRSLFKNTPHKLVFHEWLDHNRFVELVRTMDLCMQMSYSETFNMTAADTVTARVPIVASPEIRWLPTGAHADPNSVKSMVASIDRALVYNRTKLNYDNLVIYNRDSIKAWKNVIDELVKAGY